jgi:hypothetical protein
VWLITCFRDFQGSKRIKKITGKWKRIKANKNKQKKYKTKKTKINKKEKISKKNKKRTKIKKKKELVNIVLKQLAKKYKITEWKRLTLNFCWNKNWKQSCLKKK